MTFRTFSACFLLVFAASSPVFAQVGVGAFEYVSADVAPAASIRPSGSSFSPGRRIHIVQPGESLYRISQLYQVDLEELRALNNLADNVILPNQQLVIGVENGATRGTTSAVATRALDRQAPLMAKDPSYTTRTVQQTSYDFHEVKEDETLESIADTYDQPVDSIIAWNGIYEVSPLDVIRVRCTNKLVSYAVPVEARATEVPDPHASIWSTARGGPAPISARMPEPAPTPAPTPAPFSPPAAASPLDAPAPAQNWQTNQPAAETPAEQEQEDGDEGEEGEEGEAEEVPVIRTEALRLDMIGRNSQERTVAAASEEEEEEEEEDEERTPSSSGPQFRSAGPAVTPSPASTTHSTPPSPLDEVAPASDPAAEPSAYTDAPTGQQHAGSATASHEGAQLVTPATLEEGVLETGAFAVADLPAGSSERFVIYHKVLPVGTPVRILLPNNSGFVVAKVAGTIAPGSTERFALSPACVALLRVAGITGNTATIAYK